MKSVKAWTIVRADGSICKDCTASTQHLAILRCVGQEPGYRARWNQAVREGRYRLERVTVLVWG